MRTYFATAMMTCGSLSQRLSASTLLAFCCGPGSISIASAHKIPFAGHSCNAKNRHINYKYKKE